LSGRRHGRPFSASIKAGKRDPVPTDIATLQPRMKDSSFEAER
jgi:hypothetical protein